MKEDFIIDDRTKEEIDGVENNPETYYLDKFYSKYAQRKEEKLAKLKKKNLYLSLGNGAIVMCIIAFVALLVVFPQYSAMAMRAMKVIGILVIVALLVMPVYLMSKDNEKEFYEDDSNEKLLQQFMYQNNMSSLSCYGASFCINDNEIYTRKDEGGKTWILFAVLEAIYIAIVFILCSVFSDGNGILNTFANKIIFIIIGSVGVLAIAKGFGARMLKILRCSEKVEAVCIYREIKDESVKVDRRTYRSYYYVKYQNKGYILFDKRWSSIRGTDAGEMVILNINPQYPVEHTSPLEGGDIIAVIVILLFSMAPLALSFANLIL